MLNISFNFDEVTQKVSNVVVISTEAPVRQKRKKVNSGKPIIEVDENKIILSDSVIDMLSAEAGDRIAINYYTVDNQNTIPLIGKSEMFADKQSGNKLTKSNSISFKGLQRTVLLEYGSMFTLEPFEKGIYKLISINDINEIVSIDPEVKENLITEEEELRDLDNIEIDEEIEKFINISTDDLPF